MISKLLKTACAALLVQCLWTGTAQAATVVVNGSLSGGSPTINRVTDRAGFPDSVNDALPYAAIEIRTGSTGGTVTATVAGTTEFDSFVALYSSAFSAASPGANLLFADDDGNGYPHAKLTATGLAADTTYWLVLASYSSAANAVFPLHGNYSVTIDGDLASYTVTATANPVAGGTVSCTPNPVAGGSTTTCTATPNVGYTFSAFSGDCTGASCVLSNVTSAKSVTANFTLDTYAIMATASPVAGGTVSCTPNPVGHGSSSTCTATPNAGYSFTAFSGDCTGASCTLSNVTSTKSVTAGFVQNSYTVTTTASPVGGGTVSCSPNPVTHGGSTSCTATPNAGYTFGTFSGDCTGANCSLSNVTSAKSVTASFTLNSYAIAATASPVAGGTVSCTPDPVSHGGSSTCTATPNAGYSFTTFSGDCTGGTCTLSNVTSAKSVTAGFAVSTYVITATASPVAGGTVSCTPDPVAHGSSSTCTATPNAGYTFSAFSGDCTGASCTLSNVTAVKTVTASFAVNTAPTATNVAVSGAAQVGVVLTGSYTYFDAEGNAQGASTFRWMRDSQSSGATKTAIANQTAQTLTVDAAQQGDYLFFCVAPVATTGVITGTETCSAATAAVAAAAVVVPPVVEVVPVLPTPPVPGVTGAPPVLNMSGLNGPSVMTGVVNTLAPVLGSGLQFVGQTPQGSVVMAAPSGQSVVFAPLSVQTGDLRPNGLYPIGNGQYQIVAGGTALLVMPTVQNLPEMVTLLPLGTTLSLQSNGVMAAQVGGATYVVSPGVFVEKQSNPSGVPSFYTGNDGNLRFMDSLGNVQILYAAFGESDALGRLLKTLDSNSTLSIQLDGTARVTLQGQDLVLVPDLTLGGVPAGKEADYWWQESPSRYRVRVQANWFAFQSQGFSVR